MSRLGLTGFQTTFGTVSLIEMAKKFGGSETNIEPLFAEIKKILPKVAAVTSPAALPGLFQQGQIDVSYTNTNNVSSLKTRGVDIEFAFPTSGAITFITTLHIAKGAENVDAAYKYIDTALSAEVQTGLHEVAVRHDPDQQGRETRGTELRSTPSTSSRSSCRTTGRRSIRCAPHGSSASTRKSRSRGRAERGGHERIIRDAVGHDWLSASHAHVAQLAVGEPARLWPTLLFFAAPLLLLGWISFHEDYELTRMGFGTWAKFLSDPFYLGVVLGTLKLGVITVLAASVLSYPIALVFYSAGPIVRRVLLFIVLLPLLTSVVVRTFAWIAILSREGCGQSRNAGDRSDDRPGPAAPDRSRADHCADADRNAVDAVAAAGGDAADRSASGRSVARARRLAMADASPRCCCR